MKKIFIILLISSLLLSGCSKDTTTENKALTGDLELEENQSLLYGKITEINGNEITFQVVEATTTEQSGNKGMPENSDSAEEETTESESNTSRSNNTNSKDGESTNTESTDTEPNNSKSMPQNMPSSEGGAPANAQSSENSTQASESSTATDTPSSSDGNMPSPSQESDSETDSQDSDSENSSDDSDSKKSMTIYTETGEEKTMLIPVGTTVTTLLGAESTFSRIAVDNTIEMIIEQNDAGEDIIVSVYIVG